MYVGARSIRLLQTILDNPASEVGGDFYGYLTLEGGLVVVALVDASGKGLHGAMNAVMSHGLLHGVISWRRTSLLSIACWIATSKCVPT